MKKKFHQRILAVALCMVMALGLSPAAFAAPVQGGASDTGAYKTIAQYLDEQMTTFDRIDPDEQVCFIVELDETPLANTMPGGMKLADYLTTARGSVQLGAIERQQTLMAAAIEGCAEDITITRTYQVVLNGFAVSASYGDQAALEALDGVKRVTVGNVYSVPETMEAGDARITSGEMINADAVNAEGYTGKGTFAAILDTGLNVEHEAFRADAVQGAVVSAETIGALEGLTARGELYKNAKVAFAYDYADGDDDVSDVQGHGTHVAGTVAANGESFHGVAPDAQLAIMKVFGDSGSAYDADIFAALEDCVILGVDTVNMSLGSPCGFTYEDETTEAVYNAVRNAGINLMVSAGNDYHSAFQNLRGTDLALAENPDYGIVGAPSTYSAALSVASVNEALSYTSYFLLGETQVSYDENPDSVVKFADLEGDYAYVQITGVGSPNDFAKVDVIGKIALVERGEIAFTEKEQNAYDAGAVAMIVYNNSDVDETVYMQLNGLLPAVFISKEEGKLLKDAESKVVTISSDFLGRLESPVAGRMSDFSSMGVTPDLKLKPEITAPGGNVWSTSVSGGYEEMSGTSMAAPHMTGAAAVVRQYVNETFPALSDYEKQAMVDHLLISTAVPVLDENGVSYTPRKQGAGLADVSAAVHGGAYLTIDGGKPIANLGQSENGTYAFTFTVHNVSDTVKTYQVCVDAIAAQTEEHDGEIYISELCRQMGSDELTVTFSSDSIIVRPGETADVTVTLALTEMGKQRMSAFPNGIYVEGFVKLTGDDVTPLGLPYLGFFGDWADAPIFDSSMYDEEAAIMAEGAMAMMDYNGSGSYLGVNAITGNANENWISYASHTAGYYLITPMTGLLRAPSEIWYTAASEAEPDVPVYKMGYSNAYKSFYYTSGGYVYTDFVPWENSWQPIGGNDAEGYYYLEDGPYTYTIEACVDGEESYQSISYPIYIDNEAPRIVSQTYSVVDGTPYLSIQVTDNHYVMAAQLVDENFTRALSPVMAIEETELGAVTTLVFDLTAAQAEGYRTCCLDLFDYAWNETLSAPMSTTSQVIEPQTVSILEYALTASTASGNMELHATVEPENAADKTLTWTSSDENVAKIVSVSGDTMTAEIDFVGPGSCEIRATAANGVYGVSDVTVTGSTDGSVDKTNLCAAIEVCETLAAQAYTSDSWADLEEALELAKAVAADPDATQEEVNAALTALTAAQYGLVLRGDPAQLAALADQVEAELDRLAENVFPTELIDALCGALADARTELDNIDATQEMLDECHAALLAAYRAVQEYPVNEMYADIPEGVWFYDPVDFVTRYGFMNGMGDGSFSPAANVNRAQFVVILYRMAGSPGVDTDNPFVDVPAESWFTDAVLWAYANGITTGADETHFNPGGILVRQNMVTFLMRFANVMDIDTSARADLSGYTDADQVMAHAQAAMEWAVAEGIISGMTETTLGPNGFANRAQIATIIQRFVIGLIW